MSNETTVPSPTKLTLFYKGQDTSHDIRQRLSSISYLVQQLGYKFTFEMPTVHCVIQQPEPTTEKYINWRGKERTRKVYPGNYVFDYYHYYHYLQFSKELTPEELDFWRIFKLGYLSRDFDPNGTWRKR